MPESGQTVPVYYAAPMHRSRVGVGRSGNRGQNAGRAAARPVIGCPDAVGEPADFTESRRMLAFDALGDACLSVQSAPLRSLEEQAAWIDAVITVLAPEGAHLVGHSFGGTTATAYARLHADRVRSLSLLEPVFTFASPPAVQLWWATVTTLPGVPEGIREYALRQIGGTREEPAERDDADPVALMIAATSKHFTAELPAPYPLSGPQAVQLTMPVYVAIAGQNSLAGKGAAKRASQLLPGARVQTWGDATHSLPMQEAGELKTVLNDFWDTSGR